jgi:polysaccharide transporter, PST family
VEQDGWRSVAVRGLSYVGEQAIRLVLTAAVGVLVARYLGPAGLGLLSYAQSVYALLLPVALLGLPTLLVREFAVGHDWRRTMASALAAQVPVAVVTALGGFLLIAWSREFDTQAVLTAAVMVPLPLLTLSQSVRSYHEATGRHRTILISGVVGSIAASVVKIAAIVAGASVWVFALAGTVEMAVTSLGLSKGLPTKPSIRGFRQRAARDIVLALTRESWPLLLAAVAVTVYMRLDIVMLGLLAGDEEAGIYAAAARLSEVWYVLPTAAVAALRPELSRLHSQGRSARYEAVLRRFMSGAALVSYLAIAAIAFTALPLILLLYGDDFGAAAPVLQLHILATPFVFLGVAASPWFIDQGLTRTVLVRSLWGAGANITLNLLLIPTMGARGAAVATTVSYGLSAVFLNGLLRSGRRIFKLQARALLDPRELWRSFD